MALKLKPIAGNLLLVVASVLFFYVLLELVFFKLILGNAQQVATVIMVDDAYTTRTYPAERVAPNFDLICNLVRDASVRHGVGFVEPGPLLREAAASEAIHGPVDWAHFNETGYRIFGEALARRLAEPKRVDACSQTPR